MATKINIETRKGWYPWSIDGEIGEGIIGGKGAWLVTTLKYVTDDEPSILLRASDYKKILAVVNAVGQHNYASVPTSVCAAYEQLSSHLAKRVKK